MKNFIKERFHLHLFAGICLNYIIGFYEKFIDYTKYVTEAGNTYTEQVIAVVLGVLCSSLAILVVAGIAEVIQSILTKYLLQKYKKQNEVKDTFSKEDVIITGIGAILGGLLALLIHDQTLNTIMIISFIGLVSYEVIRMITEVIKLKKNQ